jgi:phosphoglucosamine mutase
MMSRLFGTDGVRGVANQPPITAEMVLEIGRATAYVCRQHEHRRHTILIGKDTRLSGYMLENALTAGICSMGVDVQLVGPLPTPGIAFLTRSMRADAGIVISASHNPYQDNGIKIFSRNGLKLPDTEEDRIEHLITSGEIRHIRPTAEQIGKARRIDDAVGRYIVFCKNTFPEDVRIEGMKIVVDCANGATYRVAPIIFWELGAEVIPLGCEPDGTNINADCGSEHTETLAQKVLETGANVGLAFDGDGDRLIAVDEKGRRINGDQILAICARMYDERGELPHRTVVSTVMSNYGFLETLREWGLRHVAAKVGDRYVLETMLKEGAAIGGEPSGHMIFWKHHTTGDGMISALQLIAAMKRYDKPLSELADEVRMYPQQIINVTVRAKPPLADLPGVQKAVRDAEAKLSGHGRVLVRYSGTQAMCRVMVEGPDAREVAALAEEIAAAVRLAVGAP